MTWLKKKLNLKTMNAFFIGGACVGAALLSGFILFTLFHQRDYAFMINVAGRQRMLLQRMTKDLLAHSAGIEPGGSLREAMEAMEVFEGNLMAFGRGGRISDGRETKEIEGIHDEATRKKLQEVMDSWGSFKARIHSYQEGHDRKILPEIYRASGVIGAQIEEAVKTFEGSVRRELTRSLILGTTLFTAYILGGILVFFFVERNIAGPVQGLIHGIQAVANGRLKTRVNPAGVGEILEALESFNTMVARLKDTIMRLDAIVQGMGEGLYLTDLDKRIIFVNPAVERITGFKPEELLGRRCEEIFRHEDYKGNRICDGWCGIERCLKAKALSSGYAFTHTARGDKVPIYIHFTPLKDEDGEIQGAIGTFMDVSREKALEEEVERHRIEIQMAREIYTRLLPQRLPSPKRLRIYAKLRPSWGISGDFYDVVPLSDHQTGIFVADVIGHGLAAAFLVSTLKAVISSQRDSMARPSAFLERVNQMLSTILGEDQCVTALYAVVDTERMVLEYASAGHPNPLVFRGMEVIGQEVHARGLPLGAFPEAAYQEAAVPLEGEDLLLFYTDGISEARDQGREEFGAERLRRAFLRGIQKGETLSAMAESILEDTLSFSRRESLEDDALLVIARVLV